MSSLPCNEARLLTVRSYPFSVVCLTSPLLVYGGMWPGTLHWLLRNEKLEERLAKEERQRVCGPKGSNAGLYGLPHKIKG